MTVDIEQSICQAQLDGRMGVGSKKGHFRDSNSPSLGQHGILVRGAAVHDEDTVSSGA